MSYSFCTLLSAIQKSTRKSHHGQSRYKILLVVLRKTLQIYNRDTLAVDKPTHKVIIIVKPYYAPLTYFICHLDTTASPGGPSPAKPMASFFINIPDGSRLWRKEIRNPVIHNNILSEVNTPGE